ncbi:hypothetical protein [Mucilaginibacter sp. SP1R1]|uniref:hypothetical protein n=1 Tax=Mucilaginibacter sp. SP1R1 TaxID=2723091 RepID=UPI001617577F|nr:hypothetical protein [Mucilaginibacter sp. SP1R1]MBB6149065.1 hypothetical protein [Mucilaginibacter sp. SP1R1]
MDNNKNRQLIIIAPTCPPGVCGVSDYAYKTALALNKFYKSVKIGVEKIPSVIPDSPLQLTIAKWPRAIQQNIKKSIPADVLLNYTPTSYAKQGVPVQLLLALSRFKSATPGNRLFVFFHETWDGSKNLKLHHQLRDHFTKSSVKYLSKLADGITVVTKEQKQKIESVTGDHKIHLSLVGANILPANKDSGLNSSRKAGEWIVFGLAHTRLWTLQQYIPLLKELKARGLLVNIYAIGPDDNQYAQQEKNLITENLGADILVQTGALKPEQVSKYMLSAQAALVGQTADSLRKSGTFAALAAHAVPVICDAPISLGEPPGTAIFRPQELMDDTSLLSSADGEKRRLMLHQWFWQTRSWEAIAADTYHWMNS